jgi:hypothetical protein
MADPAAIQALREGYARGVARALRARRPDLSWKVTVAPADEAKKKPDEEEGEMRIRSHVGAGLLLEIDATEAALLAGRDDLGDIGVAQEELREELAESWYAASCPPLETSWTVQTILDEVRPLQGWDC